MQNAKIWREWQHGSHEAPWSFGELAATSTLAGAAWLEGATCMQERSSTKWRYMESLAKRYKKAYTPGVILFGRRQT
jgi:hypothetical protein